MKKIKFEKSLHIVYVSVACYSVCICVCTLYICKLLIRNIFGHGMESHTILLYIDSIFTLQNFTSSKLIETYFFSVLIQTVKFNE